jgi:hypothetical protein
MVIVDQTRLQEQAPDDEISGHGKNKIEEVGAGRRVKTPAHKFQISAFNSVAPSPRSLTWLVNPITAFDGRGNLSARPFLPFSYYDFLGALGPARNNSIDISPITVVDHIHCAYWASH